LKCEAVAEVTTDACCCASPRHTTSARSSHPPRGTQCPSAAAMVVALLLVPACCITLAAAQTVATPSTPFADLPALAVRTPSLLGEDAQYHLDRAAAEFRRNQLAASCADFDAAVRLDSGRMGGMWQRGLSLFYCERLPDGMAQFAADVVSNPNDTEETIWHFLCNARLRSRAVAPAAAAAAAQLQLLPVGAESRPVMSVAMNLYGGSGTAAQLKAAAGKDTSSSDYFYAHLYLGLWAEAWGHTELARRSIVEAATSSYGSATDSADYMWHVARVHRRRRGWEAPPPPPVRDGMGCVGTGVVNVACGVSDSYPAGIPSSCSARCAASFLPWLDECVAAGADASLKAFGAMCRVTISADGGSGH
jgi:hypothetical protein